MAEDAHQVEARFEPLRPASRPRLIAAIVIGPMLWVVALELAAWLLEQSDAIEFALLVTAASLVVAVVVLGVLRAGRRREERRDAARG